MNCDEPVPKRSRSEPVEQCIAERRVLRSHYLVIKQIINEEKEEMCIDDSGRFQKIIGEVDRLHKLVIKPREQVTDAETLLDMASALVTSVSSFSKEGFTPSEFVSCLRAKFGTLGRKRTENDDDVSIKWSTIGMMVCPLFNNGCGCRTMIGPMTTQLKVKKVIAYRRRMKPTSSTARPEQLEENEAEDKTDTDKNMATVFGLLKRKKTVKLENLVLNRFSFAQTIENLFALSFLAKDGRVQISADDNGNHLVSPTNAPDAKLVASGEVVYHHFVFRFDFKDWELMKDKVAGEENLMPHRCQVSVPLSLTEILSDNTSLAIPALSNISVKEAWHRTY